MMMFRSAQYTDESNTLVRATTVAGDVLNVPVDMANRHYRDLLADGVAIEPHVVQIIDPLAIPLNRFQFFTLLKQMGLNETKVDAAIDAVERDENKRIEHKERFRKSERYSRNNALLNTLIKVIGKTPQDIDAAWKRAVKLK